jgi:hypothetical protein
MWCREKMVFLKAHAVILLRGNGQYLSSTLILWITPPPSSLNTLVHVLRCISGMALSTLVKSLLVLYEEGWVEKGNLIFLLPRAAAKYVDFGATSDVSSFLLAGTGKKPYSKVYIVK